MFQLTGWKQLSRGLVVLLLAGCTAIQAPTPTPIDPRQPLPTAEISAAGTAEAPAAESEATPGAAVDDQATTADAAAAEEDADPAADAETADAESSADTEAANGEPANGDDEELIAVGEEVYAADCASCHQNEGEGTDTYPALAGSQLVTGEDPSPVIELVLHGQGEMPAFADSLDETELAGVVSYIRTAWENEATAVSVEQVSQGEAGESADTATEADTASAATAEDETTDDEVTEDEAATLISAGEELYAIHCASCHQLHGNGTSAFPPLAGSGLVNAEDPAGVIDITLNGRGHMPAFAATLADQEVAAVTSFIRAEWDNNAAAVTVEQVSAAQERAAESAAADDTEEEAGEEAAEEADATTEAAAAAEEAAPAEEVSGDDADALLSAGEEVYAANCASCHQSEGEGNDSYPALAGSQLVTEEDPSAVIELVLHGQGEMPAFADSLDEEEIAAVVSYIRNSWENEATAVSVDQISGDQAGEAAPEETEETAAAEAEATPADEAETTATPAASPGEIALTIRGDEVYRVACAACHHPNGQGTERYPALAGSAVVLAAEPAAAITIVLHGQGEMPPFADILAHQEIAAVLSHVRNTWGQRAAPVTVDQVAQAQTAAATPAATSTAEVPEEAAAPADATALINAGEAVYAGNCAACHQLHGQGTTAYPALDASTLVTADAATAAIAIVRHGQGEMPAFADILDDEEIAAVVSYIRNAWDNEATLVEVAQVGQVASENSDVAND